MYGDKLTGYAGRGDIEVSNSPARPMTIRERLNYEKSSMARRIEEVDEALALLDRNPDFEKLQDLINR